MLAVGKWVAKGVLVASEVLICDIEVAGTPVAVEVRRMGVRVGISSPGPRGVVHCCLALG